METDSEIETESEVGVEAEAKKTKNGCHEKQKTQPVFTSTPAQTTVQHHLTQNPAVLVAFCSDLDAQVTRAFWLKGGNGMGLVSGQILHYINHLKQLAKAAILGTELKNLENLEKGAVEALKEYLEGDLTCLQKSGILLKKPVVTKAPAMAGNNTNNNKTLHE